MKITIVGGGSYQWSPTLIGDILTTPSLADVHVVLEDVDPAPLPKMQAYFEMAAAKLGIGATVETSTDQRAALDGADFVVVTISTGGFRSMALDLSIPEKHGIRQPVGDTVGPGGINRALRNIPVLLGIARDMEQACPDAWLLNITNPMTCLTRSVARETSIEVVGLCHEVWHFQLMIALTLGLPMDQIEMVIGGVNHLPIVTELTIAGEPGFPKLLELSEEGGAFAKEHALKLGMLERFGAVPGAGDRHVAEFFPGFLTAESSWGSDWGVHLTTIAERERDQANFVENVDLLLAEKRELPLWQSGEMVAPVIDSLTTDTRRELPLNLPNRGQLANEPLDPVVETMCVVDGDGMRGREDVVLPPPYDAWIHRHIEAQERTVEAAVTGDRSVALEAFTLDALAGRGDLRVTEAMVDDLLAATAEWLPQFTLR